MANTLPRSQFNSPDMQQLSWFYDYGLILLPGKSGDGFGWLAIIDDEELNDRSITICGYPTDKPRRTMWIAGGNISSYTADRTFYMNDTMRRQSGTLWTPVYWTVIGVHSYDGHPNSAQRFTNKMISRFLGFMNCLKLKSLRSFAFPNVYVRCDGSGVTEHVPSGGGTVNCQYKPPGPFEKFYICPVEVTPSLAPVSHCKVEIQSTNFSDVFIRLDGRGMSHFEGDGRGMVNYCQFTAGLHERFYLQPESNGCYSFRSVQFPHCYIRLDDTVFHQHTRNPEVRQKYSAACRFFNSLLSVSSGNETLRFMIMLDMLLQASVNAL